MKKKTNSLEPKPWTQKEISRLKQLYPMSHNKDIAKVFGRTITSILSKAKNLGIKKDWGGGYRVPQPPQNENLWTKEEIGELRRMYLNSSNSEIAAKLKRTPQAVQAKTRKLGLFRDIKEQGLTRKTKGGVNRWADREIEILKELYSQKSKDDVAKELRRSPKAVGIMARRLGLTSGAPRKNSWTAEDEAFLKKHIAQWPIEEIAKKLSKKPTAVQRMAWKKHFTRNCRNQRHTELQFWTKQEIGQLEYLLEKHSRKDIAAKLGRSLQSVAAKAKHLGLKKPLTWTTKNIAILKKFFPFETNVEVAKRLDKSPALIRLKAIKLGLKKSIYAKSTRKY